MRRYVAAAAVVLTLAVSAHAQFGGRGFRVQQVATALDFDGRFHYCRVAYRPTRNGWGGSWTTDYPNADINFSIRLSELTRTRVSRRASGEPNHLVVRLGGDELFRCPRVILSAPGAAEIDAAEAARLREYLLKGGMLWTDDSWGSEQRGRWEYELRKVLPAATYSIIDLPLTHPLFHTQFEVKEVPQIPNIGFFLRSGGRTSEQGADSATPYARAVLDGTGRVMVFMTHNTDIADSWEREGEDPSYFLTFGPRGYAFGIDTVLYALTH